MSKSKIGVFWHFQRIHIEHFTAPNNIIHLLSFLNYFYLFVYLAALGLSVRRLFSPGGEWELLSSCGAQLLTEAAAPVADLGLWSMGSAHVALGLTCAGACGVFPEQGGTEPVSPESPPLAGRLFTTEPPGKPKVDHTLSALLLSCWIFKNCFFVTKDIAGHFYFWATGLSESLEFPASCCLVSGGFTQLRILVRTDLNQVPESKADTNSCVQTWTVSGTTSQNRLLFLKKQCEKQCTFQAQSRGEFCCCYVPCLVDVCSVRLFA